MPSERTSGGYRGGGGGRVPYLNMNTLSLGLRSREPGTLHHVCGMKDRHEVNCMWVYARKSAHVHTPQSL